MEHLQLKNSKHILGFPEAIPPLGLHHLSQWRLSLSHNCGSEQKPRK